MSTELLTVLENIEREKGISRAVLIESIESALVSAARKAIHDKDKDVQVKVDLYTGKIKVLLDGKESVSNEFGRIAAQTAKQVIFQKLREAERNVIFNEFTGRADSIVSGTVYRFEKGSLYADLGKTEGVLPRRELSPRDSYRQGDTIRAYVLEVSKASKGPQVILSRTHPSFVRCLFQLEVPEIADGTVEIRSVSREAGDRTKIAVWSANDKIDCVGACVGVRGSRVKGVVKELQGEKIDIVRYSDDVEEFIKAALAPAAVDQVKILDKNEKKVEVIVSDDQLSLAIGKNGQNVRLASKLTGWSIDIRSKKELINEKLGFKTQESGGEPDSEKVSEGPTSTAEDVKGIEGIGPKTLAALNAAGYHSLEDLKALTEEELLKIKGIGKKTVEKILSSVRGLDAGS